MVNKFCNGPAIDEPRAMQLYHRPLILTCFMAPNPIGGDRPVRGAKQRDTVLSGKWRDAAGRSPTATAGRDKFTTGGVAIRLWCAAPPIQHMGREPFLTGGEFLAG